MGCGPSKAGDEDYHNNQQVLIKLCRERKELLKSAADHRFALAAAHVAYFRQLKDIGETLWKFVEEDLVLLSASSSPSSPSSLSSPVLTLPSDLKNSKSEKSKEDDRSSHLRWSSSSGSGGHLDIHDDEDEDDHDHYHHHHHGEVKANRAAAAGEGEGKGDDLKHRHDRNHNHHKKVKEKADTGGGSGSPRPGISYIPDPDPLHAFAPYQSSSYPQPYYPPPSQINSSYDDYNTYNSSNNPPYYNYPNPGFNYYPNYQQESSSSSNYNDNSYGFGSGFGSGTTYTAYYMKKSSTRIPTVIYEEPKHVNNPIYSYNYPNAAVDKQQQQQQRQQQPTPPSPKVSAWDYFNPFESFEGSQQPALYGYGQGYGYEYQEESNSSSPDSREVREREGIPELEEETETEVSFPTTSTSSKKVPVKPSKSVRFRDEHHENGHAFPVNNNKEKKNVNTSGSTSRNNSNGRTGFDEGVTSKRMPLRHPEHVPGPELEPVIEGRQEEGSSPVSSETSIPTTTTSGEEVEVEVEEDEEERVSVKKRGVSFEVGSGVSSHDIESSKPSSLTSLSAHGTRDLKEVVREIKDEFEAATDYGKEVSVLLEVGKEPYRSRATFLKVLLAKVCSTSLSSAHSPSSVSTALPEEDFGSRSLALTLEKLYVWEKKLYQEVKDEERLRVMYEKQCKKLKSLDEQGAESNKVEATQDSIRKLLTKINVSVRGVDAISRRIHKLRDDELQPQLKELIYGLRKMWKLMLKCHQKQFQAILESKTRALRANTGLRRDSSVRATIQLEAELLKWSHRFNNWIEMQRSYAETLNGWLERCIHYEPEVTSDGVVPFSPGRIGAPPVFVICHDWKQAMERVSESEVQTAMNDFATSLHQLWEKQDEEQRRRVKAENIYKDFEKQIRTIRMEKQRKGREHDDAFSDKNSLSMVASESGISPLDDLRVDLDSMRQRVREERAGHKEAVKLVHDAVSRTIQAGLVPIFEALESFTSEASKAFDDVRLEHVNASR